MVEMVSDLIIIVLNYNSHVTLLRFVLSTILICSFTDFLRFNNRAVG